VALVQFPLIRASQNKIGKLGIRKLAEVRNLEKFAYNRSKPLVSLNPAHTTSSNKKRFKARGSKRQVLGNNSR
jgi:hypothetical protein